MRTVGVGIIGTGFMGKAHAYGARNLPLYYQGLPFAARVAAVASGHAENAKVFAKALGVPFWTDDYRELIAHPSVDAVCVASPNDLHEEMARAAFAAGKAVYLDKPAAHNLRSAEEIARAWRESGAVGQMAFHMRFFPCTMRASELKEQGRLGRLLSFRCVYLHSGSVGGGKTGWKQRAEMGGVLYDLGAHALDTLAWLAGPPEGLTCLRQTAYPERAGLDGALMTPGDDASYLLIRLVCGATGTVEVTKIATGAMDEFRFELNGERGAIRFDLSDPNWLWFYDNEKPGGALGGERGWQKIECVGGYPPPGGVFVPYKNAVGWIRAHAHCMYTFLDGVYRSVQTCPDINDGFAVARLLDAAERSAARGGEFIRV